MSGTQEELRDEKRAKVLHASCSCSAETPLHLYPAPLPPPAPPPQLAPFRSEVTVSERSALFVDELQLLLLLFVSPVFSVAHHPLLRRPLVCFSFSDFLRGFFCGGNPTEWDNAA